MHYKYMYASVKSHMVSRASLCTQDCMHAKVYDFWLCHFLTSNQN